MKKELLNRLVKTGGITVLNTKDPKIFIGVLKFLDKTFYFILNKVGFQASVPTKYDANEFTLIKALAKDALSYYYTLGSFNRFISEDIGLSDKAKIILGVETPKIKESSVLSTEELVNILEGEGFNASSLSSIVTIKSKLERDFSHTLDNEEALERFNLMKDKVKVLKVSELANFNTDANLVYNAIKYGGTNLVFIEGPAATGKSTFAYVISYMLGTPVISIQGEQGLTKEQLIGSYVPDPDNVGSYKFVEGLLIKAYKHGWCLLVDELNMNLAIINCIFNQFTDDTPLITLENGETIKRHPNFFMIGTFNAGYVGTEELNKAFKSRGLKVIFDRLTEEEYIKRINFFSEDTFGVSLKKEFYSKLYSFGDYIQQLSKVFGESVEVCLRNAQQLISLILSKRCNYTEFYSAVAQAYTNNLTLDNDNHERLNNTFEDEEYNKKVQELYHLYNFKEVRVTKEEDLMSFEDLLNNESFDTDETISVESEDEEEALKKKAKELGDLL